MNSVSVPDDGEDMVEMPFLRKGCLICVLPDDLVSLSTRVMEARVQSLTMWESKQPVASDGSSSSPIQSAKRRSLRISVGDTVQFCLKIPQKMPPKSGPMISTTAPRNSLRMGIITRLTFATNNQECRTVGQKMARITYFGEDDIEDTKLVSPGRIIAVLSHASEMNPDLIPRVRSFFEKNDNCYRDCFMEWDNWSSEERAEYCARCTAGEMVAAAGISSPTEDQVRALLERARAVVRTARTNVESINLSRGSGEEPVARRKRQPKSGEPHHFQPQAGMNGMTGTQPAYMPQEMGMNMTMTENMLMQQQQQPLTPEDLRRRKTGEGTAVPVGASANGETTEAMLLKQLAGYREANAQLREEIARKERELRAEADRRVEEVRLSLTSEIERLSAQLKALMQRTSFS